MNVIKEIIDKFSRGMIHKERYIMKLKTSAQRQEEEALDSVNCFVYFKIIKPSYD